jgi:glycosyltransferase involved in cell wall biosynthesis
VNQSTKDLLLRWGIPEEKLSIVSSFYLDRAVLSRDVRPPISYDVSFCGRLVPNKRLSTLIEAVADIPEIRLLVIGDGPERQRCEQLAKRLGLGERITFLGWLPALEDVVGAVMTARIFVMNSRSEGGPRSALEAMGMGMPVIATPVGVMPEVIEDNVNGLFTDGSKGDLRRKIMRLIADERLRDRMGEEARKVLDRFERSALVKQYADFLKSLVPASPPRTPLSHASPTPTGEGGGLSDIRQ